MRVAPAATFLLPNGHEWPPAFVDSPGGSGVRLRAERYLAVRDPQLLELESACLIILRVVMDPQNRLLPGGQATRLDQVAHFLRAVVHSSLGGTSVGGSARELNVNPPCRLGDLVIGPCLDVLLPRLWKGGLRDRHAESALNLLSEGQAAAGDIQLFVGDYIELVCQLSELTPVREGRACRSMRRWGADLRLETHVPEASGKAGLRRARCD